MKRIYSIILFCTVLGATAFAAQKGKQPNVGAKPQRCCPNGECIKQPQSNKRSMPANTLPQKSPQTASNKQKA